jgi:electron transport complex protein RnfC
MGLMTFPGGVHPKDYKGYSKNSPIETMPLPKKVIIPLSQHIGAPAVPCVKKGDNVLVGQKIGDAGGFVSVPIHAGISGKVTNISKFPHPSGTIQMGIEITGDGEDNWVEMVDDADYFNLPIDEMKNRISEAGVCGMGGAGFPTHVKLSPPADKPIDTIILNGVECEPYLTADYRLMQEKAEDIIKGLRLIMKICGAKKGVIGIEANKPDSIKLMKELTKSDSDLSVVGLKLKYPQGAEKQLIYAATRRKVPNKGGLPMDVKVVVDNVGTAIAVYEAVRYKKPLVERVITVTGRIVKNPKNIMARVGTLCSDLLDYCGGVTEEIGKVISGGPMMGFALFTLDTPVAKTSSGLLLFDQKEAHKDKEYTCLRCGGCVDVCPLNLVPSMIVSAVKHDAWEDADKYGVMDCMKCGSCAYVCPSQIKLIQWIDIGKLKVSQLKRK